MKKVTALLTGRGNNSLRDKNVLDILGHPVLYYPGKSCKNVKDIDSFYCSSDDEKILSEAEKIGYKRILRPAELATPTAQHVDCIYHALAEMKSDGVEPDILVVLLANNVAVKSQWISDCVQLMKNDPEVTAVVPVYNDNDHHPLRGKIIEKDGYLGMYDKNYSGQISTNRQDLIPCYFLAHNFWVLNVANLYSGESGQPPWSFMGNKIKPYIIETSIDIHDKSDLMLAQLWLQKNFFETEK